MPIFDVFFWILGGLLTLTIAYLYFLGALSLFPAKDGNCLQKPQTRFLILVPAHDEASVIRRTLESIKEANYPSALYRTWVIADNCTDDTAQVSRKLGFSTVERRDRDRKGKGFALQWAFEHLKGTQDYEACDALVIIDADTILGVDFLQAMNRRLVRGELAIQGYYDVIRPEASPMASLSYLGFVLSRNLRYKGRTRIGWSSNLLGNGMCFSKTVIARLGWSATSIVEDIEYAMILQLNGIKVTFAPEARVFAEIPGTFKDAKAQRSRWDIGKFQVRNKYLPRLIREAVRKRDVSYLDTAAELLIPPFSLFLTSCFGLFGIYMAVSFDGLNGLAIVWFAIILSLMAYVLTGLLIAKANWKIYINLVYAPFFLMWRVATVLWGYSYQVGRQWLKTTRKGMI